MKTKGSGSAVQWQNACIIMPAFGQIDLDVRTWWMLSQAVFLKAKFLCLKARELLPFPETQHYLRCLFLFISARMLWENIQRKCPSLALIKMSWQQSRLTYQRSQLIKMGNHSLLSFLQPVVHTQENPERYREDDLCMILRVMDNAFRMHALLSAHRLQGWRGGSVVTVCPALEEDLRGPSTHTGGGGGGSWLPVTPAPGDLDAFFWTLWTPALTCAHSDTQTHIFSCSHWLCTFGGERSHFIPLQESVILDIAEVVFEEDLDTANNHSKHSKSGSNGTYVSHSLNPPIPFPRYSKF